MNADELRVELVAFRREADNAGTDLEEYLGTHPQRAEALRELLKQQETACEALAAQVDNRALPYAQRVEVDRCLAELRLLGHPSLGAALYAVKQSTSAAIAKAVLALIVTLLTVAF